MSKSLLEITQQILSDRTSDYVNSISDTEESEAVARMIMSTYDEMIASRNWPHTRKTFKMVSPSNVNTPTHLSVPTNCKELILFNYNNKKSGDSRRYYREVCWKEPDEFLRFLNNRNSTATNIDTVTDSTGVELLIYNDKHPKYYTSFDDVNLVSDAYDSSIENTLVEANTQGLGYLITTATFSDTWVPDLPDEAFPALIAESLSKVAYNIDDQQHIKAEQESSRQDRWLSRKAWTVNGGLKYPNYGRRGKSYGRDPNFVQRNAGN